MTCEQKEKIKEQARRPIGWFKYNVKCCYNCTKWCEEVTLRDDCPYNHCKEHKHLITSWDNYCNDYDGYAQENNLLSALTESERKKVLLEVKQEVDE